MFNVSSLLLDDALKPATPLTNGAISGVAGLRALSSSKADTLNIILMQKLQNVTVTLDNN